MTVGNESVGSGPEDYRQAEWLAQRFDGKWRFDHRTQGWFHFDGVRWAPDKKQKVHKAIHHVAVKALGKDRVGTDDQKRLLAMLQWPAQERALKALATFDEYSTDGTDWDQNGMLLAVTNGVYDFAAGGLRDGRPDDLIAKVCGTAYLTDSPHPTRFLRFLDEIYGGDGDMVAYMKRAIGALLVGGFMKAFLVLVGDTDTGKSTLIAVMKALMAEYACAVGIKVFARATFQQASNGHTRELMRLPGTRFMYAVESDDQTTLDAARIKAMTGGEPAILAAPYSKMEDEHKVMWKIWLGTNIDPVVRDESDATWSRMQVIPHGVRFWKRDEPHPVGAPLQEDGLEATLLAELPGILRLAVGWAHDYLKHGLLPLPKAGRDRRTDMQQDDAISEWFELFMEKEPGSKVGATHAYESYLRFAGLKAVSNREFGTLLLRRLVKPEDKKKAKGGGMEYHGIRFQTTGERS